MLFWISLISAVILVFSLLGVAICSWGSKNNLGEGGLMWAVLGLAPLFIGVVSLAVLAVCGIVKLCLL